MALILLMLFGPLSSSAPNTVTREQAIDELKGLKTQNSERLAEVDEKIKSLFDTSGINSIPDSEVENLQSERRELLERQKLFDRLLLQVDTKFKAGDLRIFLADRLNDMGKAEMIQNDGNLQNWKQFSYLSQALRELPERNENLFAFISGYLKQSKFQKPLKPQEFNKTRQYTNGAESVAAIPLTHEEAAESSENRVRQVEEAPATP